MGWLESRVGRFERRPGKTTWGLAGREFGGSGERDPQNMCLLGAHQLWSPERVPLPTFSRRRWEGTKAWLSLRNRVLDKINKLTEGV